MGMVYVLLSQKLSPTEPFYRPSHALAQTEDLHIMPHNAAFYQSLLFSLLFKNSIQWLKWTSDLDRGSSDKMGFP